MRLSKHRLTRPKARGHGLGIADMEPLYTNETRPQEKKVDKFLPPADRFFPRLG